MHWSIHNRRYSRDVSKISNFSFLSATESAIRLYDVNLDGVQDVILGAAATSSLDDIELEPEFCKSIRKSKLHKNKICQGGVGMMGLSGRRVVMAEYERWFTVWSL